MQDGFRPVCRIPRLELTGTADDWEQLVDKVRHECLNTLYFLYHLTQVSSLDTGLKMTHSVSFG